MGSIRGIKANVLKENPIMKEIWRLPLVIFPTIKVSYLDVTLTAWLQNLKWQTQNKYAYNFFPSDVHQLHRLVTQKVNSQVNIVFRRLFTNCKFHISLKILFLRAYFHKTATKLVGFVAATLLLFLYENECQEKMWLVQIYVQQFSVKEKGKVYGPIYIYMCARAEWRATSGG